MEGVTAGARNVEKRRCYIYFINVKLHVTLASKDSSSFCYPLILFER